MAAVGKKMTTGQALAGPFTTLYVGAFVAAVAASYMLEGTNPWQSFTYQPGPWCELERTHNFMRTSTHHLCTLRSLLPPPTFRFRSWDSRSLGGGGCRRAGQRVERLLVPGGGVLHDLLRSAQHAVAGAELEGREGDEPHGLVSHRLDRVGRYGFLVLWNKRSTCVCVCVLTALVASCSRECDSCVRHVLVPLLPLQGGQALR